jgi:hypothetical protein
MKAKFKPGQIARDIWGHRGDDRYSNAFIAVLAILVVIIGLTLLYALVKFAKP